MLQQTVVATVIPYYAKFLAAYPSISDLAAAPLDDILALWAGLGYYARARNLHACAQTVAAQGGFPRSVEGLLRLPGIGPYTAAAIAAIAFSEPVLPVDGNVERVAARLFAITTPLPASKPLIKAAAQTLAQNAAARHAPGDFVQALFDLGATICTPRNPACPSCPWSTACAAHAQGIAATLPVRAAKSARPSRHGTVFVMLDQAGLVWLRRRPPAGLLGGMLELPGTPWAATPPPATPPLAADWQDAGEILHIFTHFSLTLRVLCVRLAVLPPGHTAPAATAALPSVMRKALDAGRRALNITG